MASGGKGVSQALHTKEARSVVGWRTEPYTLARLPPEALSIFRTIVGSGESGFKTALDKDLKGDGVLGG